MAPVKKKPISLPDALKELTKSLRLSAKNITGFINFPEQLDDTIRAHIKSTEQGQDSFISEEDIAPIVRALEVKGQSLCGRLRTKAFILLFAVLRLAEPCPDLERGLHLLTESLQEDDTLVSNAPSTPQEPELSPLQRRKKRIGREILVPSLATFCQENRPRCIRRWMGLLIVELLKDTTDNCGFLATIDSSQRTSLGYLILKEQDAVLKLVTGAIFRELQLAGARPQDFWPKDTEVEVLKRMPSPVQDQDASLWAEAFLDFTNSIQGPGEVTRIFYSFAISAVFYGEKKLVLNNEPSWPILVCLRDSLTMFIFGFNDKTTECFDIAIHSVTAGQVAPKEGESSDPHQLTLQLKPEDSPQIVHNGICRAFKTVTLSFHTKGSAERLISRIKGILTTRSSVSEDLVDASQEEKTRKSIGSPRAPEAQMRGSNVDEQPLIEKPETHANKMPDKQTAVLETQAVKQIRDSAQTPQTKQSGRGETTTGADSSRFGKSLATAIAKGSSSINPSTSPGSDGHSSKLSARMKDKQGREMLINQAQDDNGARKVSKAKKSRPAPERNSGQKLTVGRAAKAADLGSDNRTPVHSDQLQDPDGVWEIPSTSSKKKQSLAKGTRNGREATSSVGKRSLKTLTVANISATESLKRKRADIRPTTEDRQSVSPSEAEDSTYIGESIKLGPNSKKRKVPGVTSSATANSLHNKEAKVTRVRPSRGAAVAATERIHDISRIESTGSIINQQVKPLQEGMAVVARKVQKENSSISEPRGQRKKQNGKPSGRPSSLKMGQNFDEQDDDSGPQGIVGDPDALHKRELETTSTSAQPELRSDIQSKESPRIIGMNAISSTRDEASQRGSIVECDRTEDRDDHDSTWNSGHFDDALPPEDPVDQAPENTQAQSPLSTQFVADTVPQNTNSKLQALSQKVSKRNATRKSNTGRGSEVTTRLFQPLEESEKLQTDHGVESVSQDVQQPTTKKNVIDLTHDKTSSSSGGESSEQEDDGSAGFPTAVITLKNRAADHATPITVKRQPPSGRHKNGTREKSSPRTSHETADAASTSRRLFQHARTYHTNQTVSPLVDEEKVKKPSIVGFGKYGPLNQGFSMERTSHSSKRSGEGLQASRNMTHAYHTRRPEEQNTQTKQVTELGSPVASQKQKLRQPQHKIDAAKLADDLVDDTLIASDTSDDAQSPGVLFDNSKRARPKTSRGPKLNTSNGAVLSSNRKTVPSSPNAPSRMLEDLEMHTEQPQGYVSVKGADVVRPTPPEDPFNSSQSSIVSGPFLKSLHEAVSVATNPVMQEVKETIEPTFDPDETLVNTRPPKRSSKLKVVEILAASSSSENEDSVESSTPDPETARATEVAQWEATLRADQKQTLTSLYDLSIRWMRHLMSKEAVVYDIVNDFKRAGTNLVNKFRDEVTDRHLKSMRVVNKAKRKIGEIYEKAEKDLQARDREQKRVKKEWTSKEKGVTKQTENLQKSLLALDNELA